MERTNYNIYLFKALEAYPYELEKAVEALNYALSYEPKNATALLLMARVYSEQLGDYETAKEYYAEALAADMNNPNIYLYYAYTLFLNEDYEEAKKLLDYALTVRATDKVLMHYYLGLINEAQMKYTEAIKAMKVAREQTLNEDFDAFLGRQIQRIEKKISQQTKEKRHKDAQEKSKKTGVLRRLNLL
ncbi:tetratricopeptide repeat protein [Flagellimonas sp. S3867]|uniref:tetratricopeptide repeat protein n=1 Tax=Flagellimonas sp. S3867 TaxID=2768063 RepID=UPI001686A043|nr:tetratricopeptide repeat protein [Flagellimonas sp. S3867]